MKMSNKSMFLVIFLLNLGCSASLLSLPKTSFWRTSSIFEKLKATIAAQTMKAESFIYDCPFIGSAVVGSVVTGGCVVGAVKTYHCCLSSDVEKTDPELYELFDQVRKDAKIDKKIALRVLSPYHCMTKKCSGFYQTLTPSTVYINPDLKRNQLVQVYRHELEHYRQFHNYPGSISGWTSSPIQVEHEADKAAADYIKCHECLSQIAKTAVGGEARGYFAESDYQPYIHQALESNVLCQGHTFCDCKEVGPGVTSMTYSQKLLDYVPTMPIKA